jgi:hypothetical protein
MKNKKAEASQILDLIDSAQPQLLVNDIQKRTRLSCSDKFSE